MDLVTYVELLGFACCLLVYQLVPALHIAIGLTIAFASLRFVTRIAASVAAPQPMVDARQGLC